MFAKISTIAFDADCFPEGKEDFVRSVPCDGDGGLCREEDDPPAVVPGSQLTYRIRDPLQARFWYVSLVSCRRDADTCRWEHARGAANVSVDYDLWLVNGDPSRQNRNPFFKYQYSYDQQVVNLLHLVTTTTSL